MNKNGTEQVIFKFAFKNNSDRLKSELCRYSEFHAEGQTKDYLMTHSVIE